MLLLASRAVMLNAATSPATACVSPMPDAVDVVDVIAPGVAMSWSGVPVMGMPESVT